MIGFNPSDVAKATERDSAGALGDSEKSKKIKKKNRRSLGINLPHTIIRIFNSRDDDEARQLTLALHLVFPKKVKVEGTS